MCKLFKSFKKKTTKRKLMGYGTLKSDRKGFVLYTDEQDFSAEIRAIQLHCDVNKT